MFLCGRFIALVALSALPLLASPVAAQNAPNLKTEMVGQWELATTERSKTCVVTLKGDTTPQGMKLELEPGCAAALPFTRDIAAWNIKGLGDIVRLQDAAGQPVIDFTEVESGIFEGLRTNEGVYILQNLAAARSLAMVLIYTHLGQVSLTTVIVVNVLMFVGIFSRMLPSQAVISAIPDASQRGSFSAVSSSLQQFSGGLGSVLAAAIIAENADGSLRHFDWLGYIVVATSIVSLALMYFVQRSVSRRDGRLFV